MAARNISMQMMKSCIGPTIGSSGAKLLVLNWQQQHHPNIQLWCHHPHDSYLQSSGHGLHAVPVPGVFVWDHTDLHQERYENRLPEDRRTRFCWLQSSDVSVCSVHSDTKQRNPSILTRRKQTPPVWRRGTCPQAWWGSTLLWELGTAAAGSTWQTGPREKARTGLESGNTLNITMTRVRMSTESVCLYQLGYVVDDDQVGPGVPEAEVGLIINPTELTDPAERAGNITLQPAPGSQDSVHLPTSLLWW